MYRVVNCIALQKAAQKLEVLGYEEEWNNSKYEGSCFGDFVVQYDMYQDCYKVFSLVDYVYDEEYVSLHNLADTVKKMFQ